VGNGANLAMCHEIRKPLGGVSRKKKGANAVAVQIGVKMKLE